MASHIYQCKSNYFAFLSSKPKAWELIYPISSNVQRNDTIVVQEVLSNGTPTGNELTGIVGYVSTNNEFTYSTANTLLYIIPNP